MAGNGVFGGAGGAGVSFAAGGANFTNSGTVTGGDGGFGARAGGAGVSFAASGATFMNSGMVTGGRGGDGGFVNFAGQVGGAGGAGVSFAASGATFMTFMNTGLVTGGGGGNGGNGGFSGNGGGGGPGMVFAGGGATFMNTGVVTGGGGGNGGDNGVFGGNGGGGGPGMVFAGGGATFTNSGTVTGGGGGSSGGGVGRDGAVGAGGAGVVGIGLTIVNGGVISGGLSADGVTRADAIDLTGGANVLELRAGSTIVGNVVATGSDLLRLGGAANSAFDASALGTQYQGFGSVEKSGASDWTVTGSTNARAPWTLNQGVLTVNGSIASASLTTVNAGATLAGIGGVGNLLVASGGMFAPGMLGGTGTMTVAGNLAFQSASTYSVQIEGTAASRADVSGAALLNGTVVTTFVPGASLARSYNVLHADGGLDHTQFAGFNDPPNFLESLSYGANDVFVDLTAALGAGASLPGNQQSVANALNGYFNAGGLLPPNFIDLYGLTGNALSNALVSASGEAATGAQESAFQSMDAFIEAMLDPIVIGRSDTANPGAPGLVFLPGGDVPTHKNGAVFEAGWTSWAASFSGYGRIDGDPTGTGSHDLSANTFGVAAGLDYHLTRDTLVGAALGGGRTSWGLSQGLGGGAGDLFDLGAYASTRVGPTYVSGALAFGNQWMRTSRTDPFGEALSADFVSQTYGGRIEGGYRLATPAGGLTPYAALEAMDFNEPSFQEKDCCAGGFGLAYAGRTASDIRSEFGARFDDVVAVQSDASLALRARLAWIHDWVSDPTVGASFETLPGAGFNVVGAIPAKNVALLSGAAELRLARGATVGARFDGELASGAHAYAGTVFLKVSF